MILDAIGVESYQVLHKNRNFSIGPLDQKIWRNQVLQNLTLGANFFSTFLMGIFDPGF